MAFPSGEQYEIASGDQRAVITEVGATLRSYERGGTAVLDGFGADTMAPGGKGQVLAPWPNRLGDGRYRFGEREGRAAWDEPEGANAIHGLVRWLPWSLHARAGDAVTLRCLLHPQPAYPWRLELRLEYRLGDDGLTVTTEARNHDSDAAPFGIGFHPYLTVGTPTIDAVTLLVPARRRLLTDERSLPTGEQSVQGTPFDFSHESAIGAAVLDTAYTDLVRDADGAATTRLRGPDGRQVSLWVDGGYRYLMVFTGDTLDPPEARRRGVAVEPMTCPPDAFRTGVDLIAIGPSERWSARWGITVEGH